MAVGNNLELTAYLAIFSFCHYFWDTLFFPEEMDFKGPLRFRDKIKGYHIDTVSETRWFWSIIKDMAQMGIT